MALYPLYGPCSLSGLLCPLRTSILYRSLFPQQPSVHSMALRPLYGPLSSLRLCYISLPSVSSLMSLSLHFFSCLFPLSLPLSFPLYLPLSLLYLSLLFLPSVCSPLSLFSYLIPTVSFPPFIFLYAVCLSHMIYPPLSLPSFSSLLFLSHHFFCFLFTLSLPLSLPSATPYFSSLCTPLPLFFISQLCYSPLSLLYISPLFSPPLISTVS